MSRNTAQNDAFGFSQPLISVFLPPVQAKRIPTANDINYQNGRIWIANVAGVRSLYILASVLAGVADWRLLETGGGAGAFSTLTSSGVTSLATGGGATTAGGSFAAATTITAGTGITSTTGNIAASAGAVSASTTVTAGTGITATTGNIVASTGNITSTLGSVGAATTVTAGTSMTATLGNITASNGDVVISTAAKGVTLPGGQRVISAATSPNGVVTAVKGSLCLVANGSGTNDRAYINTDGATAWTAIVTVA